MFRKVTEQSALKAAWRKVHANGIASRSTETQEEVEAFGQNAEASIRRIQRELRADRYSFQPALGKRIPKKIKGDFRPIVVAPVETRIIQRAVLDKLLRVQALQQMIHTPYSFGGIRKKEDDGHAAVPAAIKAVLNAKSNGLCHVRCADISAFFTKINMPEVRRMIADVVRDEDFMGLFDDCIRVELANLVALRADADRFPTGDLGVAQGSALSPLLGNILLYEFDCEMNEGDCACLRYVDDLIILAPTEMAANARFRKAVRLLERYGMELSPSKSAGGATTFERGFSFLGIELANGLIRPDGEAIGRFKQKVTGVLNTSKQAMISADRGFPKQCALIPTLRRLSGIVVGWAKHYRFCNDKQTFRALDEYVDNALRDYLGAYGGARERHSSLRREFLGVGTISAIDWAPFTWPR